MVKYTALLAILMILMPQVVSAQGSDDPMVKELEAFMKGKNSGGALSNDAAYNASLARRKFELREINDGIKIQDKALTGSQDDIEKAITLYGSRAKSRGRALDHYLFGRILGQTGELDEAYRQFRTALALDKFLPWAWDGLGVYHSNKKNWPEAIEKFKRVIQLWPGHPKATFGLAQCYFRLNRFSEGVARLQELLYRPEVQNDPDSMRQTRLLIAEAFRNQKKFAEAIEVLDQVLKDKPNDKRVLRMKVWCLRRLERLEEAIKILKDLMVIDPAERRNYEQCVDCLVSLGRNADAIGILERMIKYAVGDLTPPQIDRYHEMIADLKMRKPVEDPRNRKPTLETYLKNLSSSPHVEKRREAVKVLSKVPPIDRKNPNWNILYRALIGALKDRDHVVKCIALKEVNRRYGSEPILNVIRLFADSEVEKDPRVRGLANHILREYPKKMVTPYLIRSMAKETDVYVFRRIHESLNATTLAWIERVLPNDLEVQDMAPIRSKWMSWYRKNRDLYRRNEPAGFKLP